MARKLDSTVLEAARRSLRRRDPVLGRVIADVGPCRMRSQGTPYANLMRAVIYQQLAGAAAGAIDGRLKARFDGRYPKPSELLATRPPQLRAVGLSRQKIAALKSLAQAFDSGAIRPRRLYHMDDAAVIEALTTIRGVGVWTAHMLLMSTLGRLDILPVGDYGVRKAMQQLDGLDELPRPQEMEARAEPWRPYRSVASWYLWRSLDIATPT